MRLLLLPMCFFCGFLVSTEALSQEKLILAVDVIRHGDRTPTINIPTSSYHWKDGLGQLTAKGMQQEYQLGETLRKAYVETFHLLPANYTFGTMYVRSSDVDRTLMSAQSLLMGLYPLGTGPHLPDSIKAALPSFFQPIPVHTVDHDEDKLLIPWTKNPKFKEYLKQYVYDTPVWKKKMKQVAPKFPKWSKATGIEITDLFQLKSLADALYIGQTYDVPLPKDLTPKDAKEIIDTGRWVFVNAFKPVAMGKKTGGDLLKRIAVYLQDAATQKSHLKYLLLSSHDSTQFSLLSAMSAPLDAAPPYASDLNFSLFESDKNHYAVKITFNSKAVMIPACNNTNTCSLEEFIALAN
jgi:hypothetical protein